MKLSKRGNVAPFLAMDVLSRAASLEAEGRKIIHMEVGQPGEPVPPVVLNTVRNAFDTGRQGYTEAKGIHALRLELARHYRDTYNVHIDPARFVATVGSSGGFALAFLAFFEAGARIGLPVPGYPAYRNIMSAFCLEPALIRTNSALTKNDLEAAHRNTPLDGLLIASPNNPTGTVIPPDELKAIAAFCRAEGITLISDEIYHGLVFSGRAASALEFDEQAIVVSSFSKYFCMTGWRIGWMVLPETATRQVEQLAQSLFISPPELSQHAGVAALQHSEAFKPVFDMYDRNRTHVANALSAAGLTKFFPMDGAFYCFVDIQETGLPSSELTRRLLDEAGIATTPGADFDPEWGDRYFRLSYAGTEADVVEGMERLKTWFAVRNAA
ncbi:MAG: aminotransferase class I/II-fold pyridoxal phosphate-dependent enzyme [Pseudomonadota bacterium]